MDKRQKPGDLAQRMGQASARRRIERAADAFRRETFALTREAAREKAKDMFKRFPKAGYMTEIESWREFPTAA